MPGSRGQPGHRFRRSSRRRVCGPRPALGSFSNLQETSTWMTKRPFKSRFRVLGIWGLGFWGFRVLGL